MPYMTSDLEPGVDDSREINYNPVLLHQMEEEARRARDAKRANAKGGGGGFMGTSGAVKKLKLGIEKLQEPQACATKKALAARVASIGRLVIDRKPKPA